MKANTCFLRDTWREPTASFRTAAHAVSHGSITPSEITALYLSELHTWLQLPSVTVIDEEERERTALPPSLPPTEHSQFCFLGSLPVMPVDSNSPLLIDRALFCCSLGSSFYYFSLARTRKWWGIRLSGCMACHHARQANKRLLLYKRLSSMHIPGYPITKS